MPTKPTFNALQFDENISVELKKQTDHMMTPIDELPKQKHQGSTDTERYFWKILMFLFLQIIRYGHILMRDTLYVCDNNGTLHPVSYQFVKDLICSLCNSNNLFLLDYSLFRYNDGEYVCKFPSEWSAEYYMYFFQNWIKKYTGPTLSTSCFRITQGQVLKLFSPSIVQRFSGTTLTIPVYTDTDRFVCSLTQTNLKYLGLWDRYMGHDERVFSPGAFLNVSCEYPYEYPRHTLQYPRFEEIIIKSRRGTRLTHEELKFGRLYHNALCLYLAYLGCSTHINNDLIRYIGSFVGIEIVFEFFA